MSETAPVALAEETGSHLAYLDGWRGLAILAVLVGHFGLDGIFPRTSSLGVDLFFVLSGRLMAEILFVRKSPLPTFFLRRFSRVYPGLFCFIVVATVALWSTPLHHGLVAVALALTFTYNYASVLTHPVAAFDHLWSLCVEEHTYVVLAILAFFARRRSLPVASILALMAVAALADGLVSYYVVRQSGSIIWWRSDVASSGILLAAAMWLGLRARRVPGWVSPAALAVAIVAREAPWVFVSVTGATVLLALAIVTVDHAKIFRALLANPILCRIGLWSYSLYLWQQPFYEFNRLHSAPMPLLVASAFAAALASYYWVEQPARKALNRRWGRRGAAA